MATSLINTDLAKYDVRGTNWAGEVKDLFKKAETTADIPDTSSWKVTGNRKNYSLEFADGTSVKLTGLVKYDDEGGRIQQLVNNLAAYKSTLDAPKEEVEEAAATENDGAVVDTEIGRAEGADEVVEKNVVEELKEVDLGDSEEAQAAEEALSDVAETAAAALGGEQIGDVTQTSESFTKETEIAEQTALTQEDVDKAIQDALESYKRESAAEAAAKAQADAAAKAAAEEAAKVSTKTSVLSSVPQAVQTVASGTATGGTKEKEAAKSIGPAEDTAIESYTRGRRSTILTEPGGLLTSADETKDRRLRTRRSLLAG